MTTFVLQQALFHRPDGRMPQLQARSAGFRDDWLPEAEHLAIDFGARPGQTPCPLAIFARPLTADQVAVVRVVDVPIAESASAPPVLGFHFLVLERRAYERLGGDPFVLAEQVPATWHGSGEMPALTVRADAIEPRSLEQVRRVLQRIKVAALHEDEDPEAPDFRRTVDNSESPVLLGGAQVLVDGGRLVFERPSSDIDLVAGLWLLLPTRLRCRLWPASFAFGNALDCDVVVVPGYDPAEYEGFTTEQQAGDYPQGSYELALQLAVESGDRAELERVFERRSGAEVLRLAIVLLVVISLVVLGGRFMGGLAPAPPAPLEQRDKAAVAGGVLAGGDPWTAVTLLEYGNVRWRRGP